MPVVVRHSAPHREASQGLWSQGVLRPRGCCVRSNFISKQRSWQSAPPLLVVEWMQPTCALGICSNLNYCSIVCLHGTPCQVHNGRVTTLATRGTC
ncbi:unnamed protein product [Chondrus crispus]|uniref:Uncharacterized protein n=1 Tax=Chondrus crispus TaxID=2769 RepID=R7QIA4_CHOCR|nr:unnamed protein product [Chondrus crispus]CDF37804.1 unnamed protein product [Chondrus crispus]|eukprot:XP_005717675.1 unnamed protein product [Chondrus crispus]